MILDRLEHIGCYRGIHPNLDRAIDELEKLDLAALPLGRREVNGQKVYYTVMEEPLRGAEGAKLERHRRYLDIQILIKGAEDMGYKPADEAESWDAYDGEKVFRFPCPGTIREAELYASEDVLPYSFFNVSPLEIRREGDFAVLTLPPHSAAKAAFRLD